jgi:hypothetical protein
MFTNIVIYGPRAANHRIALNKMFLEFNFRRGGLYAKIMYAKICILAPMYQHVWRYSSTSGRPQIKKLPRTKSS